MKHAGKVAGERFQEWHSGGIKLKLKMHQSIETTSLLVSTAEASQLVNMQRCLCHSYLKFRFILLKGSHLAETAPFPQYWWWCHAWGREEYQGPPFHSYTQCSLEPRQQSHHHITFVINGHPYYWSVLQQAYLQEETTATQTENTLLPKKALILWKLCYHNIQV